MKKLILGSTALLAAIILASCSNQTQTDGKDSTENVTPDQTSSIPQTTLPGFSASDYRFSYNGTELIPGMKMSEVKDKLGETTDYSEAPSCYAEGNDKVFEYSGGLTVYTYPSGEDDIISIIELSDDTLSTPKGAKTGMSWDEITALYGSEYTEEGLTKVYYLDDGRSLSFSVENDKVVLIEYLNN